MKPREAETERPDPGLCAAVQDPRAAGRISRFTSVSGPDLQHFSRWIRERLRHPRGWSQLLGQLLRSFYVAVFRIPLLPEVLWRFFLTGSYERATGRTVGNNPIRGLAPYRQTSKPGASLRFGYLFPSM